MARKELSKKGLSIWPVVLAVPRVIVEPVFFMWTKILPLLTQILLVNQQTLLQRARRFFTIFRRQPGLSQKTMGPGQKQNHRLLIR